MTFSKENIWYEYDVYSRSKQVLILQYQPNIAAVTVEPKIMHTHELLFMSASRQLLVASLGSLALGFCKMLKLLYG